MEELVPVPAHGRTVAARRRVLLADVDARGRLRLEAVARFLQDVAIDDVQETGWGTPEHLWFVRFMRVDVIAPPLADSVVKLVTWCSGVAPVAAGRRWSLAGDRGGRIEVDSVCVHLDREGTPTRIGDFGAYREPAGGRRVTTRPQLPDPAGDVEGIAWPLRATDVDPHGHVNNAVHWQAIEHLLLGGRGPDPRAPMRARLEFREPIDLGDPLELLVAGGPHRLALALRAGPRLKAVAAVEPLG